MSEPTRVRRLDRTTHRWRSVQRRLSPVGHLPWAVTRLDVVKDYGWHPLRYLIVYLPGIKLVRRWPV